MLTYLDEKVHHFNDNYLLLKKYLHDASSRLKNTWNDATLVSYVLGCPVIFMRLIVFCRTFFMNNFQEGLPTRAIFP